MDYNVGHGTTAALAKDITLDGAAPFDPPAFTNGEASLSTEEAQFFKSEGFLFKRALLEEPETFERVIDHFWAQVPRGLLRRDDPTSWYNVPEDAWTEDDAVNVGRLHKGNWKARSRGGIGTETFLVDGIANHPRMRTLAECFIGGPIKKANRVRGIYAIFPHAPETAGQLGPHADYMAAQLAAMVFIDDIPPHCGGFTICRVHTICCIHTGTRCMAARWPRSESRVSRRRETRCCARSNQSSFPVAPVMSCSGIRACCIRAASITRPKGRRPSVD